MIIRFLRLFQPLNKQHNHDYAGEVKGQWVRERKRKTKREGGRTAGDEGRDRDRVTETN